MNLRPVLAAALLFALPAAQADVGERYSSAIYGGIGAARIGSDFDNLGEAINLSAVGGYHLTPALDWGRLSVEFNADVSVSPGKNSGVPAGTSTGGGGLLGGGGSSTPASGKFTQDSDDLAMQTFSLLGVYRSPGRFYGIAQAGYSLINSSIDEITAHGRGAASFGAGAGFRFDADSAGIEVLYTRVSEDLSGFALRITY